MDRVNKGERPAIALSLGLAIWYVLVAIGSDGIAEMATACSITSSRAMRHCIHSSCSTLGQAIVHAAGDALRAVRHGSMAVFQRAARRGSQPGPRSRALRPAGDSRSLSFPLFVMLAPLYRLMVVAGMTEIPVRAADGGHVLLLMRDRPVLAATRGIVHAALAA
jgi:hypothetical protein